MSRVYKNYDISMRLAEALAEFTAKKISLFRAVESVTGGGNLYPQVMKALENECGTYLHSWEIAASDRDIYDLFERTIEAHRRDDNMSDKSGKQE